LAAESLGLDICYISSTRNNLQEVINLLEIPRLTLPLTSMTISWQSKPPHPSSPDIICRFALGTVRPYP
jgi:nitroreductase